MIIIKKSKFNRYLFITMFLSIYLVSYYVRQTVLGNLADVNFLFIITLIIYGIINRKNINYKIFVYISMIIIYILFIDIVLNHDQIKSIIRSLGMYIVPLYLLGICIKKDEIEGIYTSSLKLINFFTIIIFFIGLIDPFIGFRIMRFMGTYIVPGIKQLIYENTILPGYRYTSYMGHALFTKELFLYFYFLNIIYFKKFNKKLMNLNIVTIIAFIGIFLTGSKTGAAIILISILVTNYRKSKILNFMFPIIIIIGGYIVGLFNTLILRLKTETLTTGRTLAGDKFSQLAIMKIKLLYGYGEDMIKRVILALGNSEATAAFEYPFKILLFKYGVFCTILIYIMIFIMPIIKFIKDKEYYILFAFVLKAIDINTYNGMIYKPDNMILFVLFTSILISVSGYKTIKERK